MGWAIRVKFKGIKLDKYQVLLIIFGVFWLILSLIVTHRRKKKLKTLYGDNFEKLSKLDNLDKLGELVNEIKKINTQKELSEDDNPDGNQEKK
jgi:hypothetical protein